MTKEITIENLRVLAGNAGLELSNDELQRLLPGINRARKQAAELRELIAAADEPCGIFTAPRAAQKQE